MWLRSGAIRPNGRARSPWSIRHGVLRAPNITFISAETTSTGGKGRRFVRVKGALNAAKGRSKPAKPPCLAPKTMAVSQTQGPLCPMSVNSPTRRALKRFRASSYISLQRSFPPAGMFRMNGRLSEEIGLRFCAERTSVIDQSRDPLEFPHRIEPMLNDINRTPSNA